MRFAKVRSTDYRTPPEPRDRESAGHDAAIAGYPEHLLIAVRNDLCARRAHDLRDAEHRFILGRRAAVLRKLNPTSPT